MEKHTDYAKIEKQARIRSRVRSTAVHILLSLWAVIVLFPFYWMVLTSVKSYSAYNSEYIPKFFTLSPTLQNYVDAFTAVPLGRYFTNTLVFTLITTLLMLSVITLAAFAFARLEFKGKRLAFTLLLSLMMIPNELVIITNFVTITDLGLRNTFTGLILPSVTSVFYIYLLTQFFSQVPAVLRRKGGRHLGLQVSHQGNDTYLQPNYDNHSNTEGHRVLELLRLATAHHRRRELLPGLQRHTGHTRKRLWPGKHTRHDGGGSGNISAAHSAVSDIPQQDNGRRIQRRYKGLV